MKKLFSLILGVTALLGLFGFTFACEEVNLNDGDICVDIEQNGNDYTLNADVNCDTSSCSLYCDILLPDNTLENVGACNGTFEWDGDGEEKVLIYVNLNNDYDTIEEYYDFDDGDRGNGSSSNDDLNSFDFTYIEDASPDKDKWITVKIEAQDDGNDRVYDYDDRATLVFEYKDGYSRKEVDRHDIKIKSDDFYDDEDDLDSNGELEERFDNGRLEFEVWFENEDEYRITIKDGSKYERQKFDVGDNGGNNSDIDGFTNNELETIDRIYKIRPRLIKQLKDENRDLDHDNERDDMSDDLYDDMKNVLDDENNRSFDNYDEFFEAFEEWYNYTLDIIH